MRALVLAILLTGCHASAPADQGGEGLLLPVLHAADPARATRGKALLAGGTLAGGLVPTLAIRNLWLVWGDGAPTTDAAYWAAFRTRYGFVDGGDRYPIGLHETADGQVGFDCSTCHVGRVAGQTIVGLANGSLQLERLYDDLVALNQLAPKYGYPSYPVPFEFTGRTGAPGSTDAMGLGLELASKVSGAGVSTHLGFQQPSAWWTAAFKDQLYVDGSGQTGGYRTMMATLLASGRSFTELEAMDEDFLDLWNDLLSLRAPTYPFAIDEQAAAAGRAVFTTHCASCHGTYEHGAGQYPGRVIAATDVGTDPIRASRFGASEAALVNGSWFGADHPMTATDGYLAPPLLGVWATAPYFHAGSVPDLASVLDSTTRPAVWQRTGDEVADYDTDRVGLRFTTPSASDATFDSSKEGLATAGHTYGDALSSDERRALIEYCKTL